MDLNIFDENTLLLAALKSEIDSERVYQEIAGRTRNALLKNKLAFLAAEEESHRTLIEGVYRERFPARPLVIPESSPVPLPALEIADEMMPLSEVFMAAMRAEKAACEFYRHMATRYEDNPTLKKTIEYVATMEMGHYRLLDIEKDNMERFEDFDVYTPLIHVGA